ncbi:MAG: ferrous iron transporter B, partial [bacterium]|nr:ferrous iron transporter B [bacterium]
AGLYDLYKSGGLTDNQLVIAAIVLTLFVPCVAHFAVIVKERGWKVGSYIATFVFLFALLTGIIVNVVFNTFGVVL